MRKDIKILHDVRDFAEWLIGHYDELPTMFDPHITDAVVAAEKFILEVRGIQADSAEHYRSRFTCGRLPVRTL